MDSADQRPVYSVDVGSPGTDAAAETSAALAAASIVFKNIGEIILKFIYINF